MTYNEFAKKFRRLDDALEDTTQLINDYPELYDRWLTEECPMDIDMDWGK